MHNDSTAFETDTRNDTESRMIRDRLLVDLICYGSDHSETIRRRLAEKGIHPYFSYPTIALLEIASNFHDTWTRRCASNELRMMIEKQLSNTYVVFMDDSGCIGVLFDWDDQETIRNLQYSLNKMSNYPVTFGIGNPCHYLSELRTSYLQAICSLQHKFYRGIGHVIFFNSVESFAETVEYPEENEDGLLQLLHDPTTKPVGQAVDAFYEALLRHGPLQQEQISGATIRLLIGLELRVKTIAGNDCSMTKPDIMAVLRMQSLDEIKTSVTHYVQCLTDEIGSQSNESVNRKIIKKTLTYMEDEYDSATLQYVAEKVFITPAYLSTLFKTNMGVTFIEHLTDIRIRKAKKLLKQTYLKNYEVAEKVGYHDSRYFSQIFKKKVGLSPSEYRNSMPMPS